MASRLTQPAAKLPTRGCVAQNPEQIVGNAEAGSRTARHSADLRVALESGATRNLVQDAFCSRNLRFSRLHGNGTRYKFRWTFWRVKAYTSAVGPSATSVDGIDRTPESLASSRSEGKERSRTSGTGWLRVTEKT